MNLLPNPAWWVKQIVFAVIAASIAGYSAHLMHKHDMVAYDKLDREFTTFKASTTALGAAAKTAVAKQELHDRKNKERTDEEARRRTTDFERTIAGLRDAADRARSRGLPPPPATSPRPDLYCVERAEFEREDGILTKRLLEGARRLADEGSKATIDLDAAKRWAAK